MKNILLVLVWVACSGFRIAYYTDHTGQTPWRIQDDAGKLFEMYTANNAGGDYYYSSPVVYRLPSSGAVVVQCFGDYSSRTAATQTDDSAVLWCTYSGGHSYIYWLGGGNTEAVYWSDAMTYFIYGFTVVCLWELAGLGRRLFAKLSGAGGGGEV